MVMDDAQSERLKREVIVPFKVLAIPESELKG